MNCHQRDQVETKWRLRSLLGPSESHRPSTRLAGAWMACMVGLSLMGQTAVPPQAPVSTPPALASGEPAATQTTEPLTLKSASRLVTADVVVTDVHGRTVTNLSKKDFQIQEKIGWATRVPETIVSFRRVDSTTRQKEDEQHEG